jgi:hypothetical protein
VRRCRGLVEIDANALFGDGLLGLREIGEVGVGERAGGRAMDRGQSRRARMTLTSAAMSVIWAPRCSCASMPMTTAKVPREGAVGGARVLDLVLNVVAARRARVFRSDT